MTERFHDKDFYVVGVGTRTSRDDEIGLRLVEQLALERELSEHCVILEAADAASVTSFILDRQKPLLVVDCADMGIRPGEHRLFFDCDATIRVRTDSVSVHGLGLSEGIALARALGFEESVQVFAVQPFDLSPCPGLTPEMKSLFDLLLFELKVGVDAMSVRLSGNGEPS
jgi:hydrogenase maturation protease